MWGNQDALVANWGPIPSGSYVVIPRDELQIEVTSTIKIQADPSRTTGSVIDIRDTSNNKLRIVAIVLKNNGFIEFFACGVGAWAKNLRILKEIKAFFRYNSSKANNR